MGKAIREFSEQARWLVLEHGLPVGDAITKTLDSEAGTSFIGDESKVAKDLARNLTGFGVLQEFLENPDVEEFWINRPNEVFVHRNGVTDRIELDLDASALEVIVERMLRLAGRRVDRSTPFVDAKLPGGSRLHVVIPDVAKEHVSLNVRRFRLLNESLEDLVGAQELGAIHVALAKQKTILVSGATATGKTTMLCSLIKALPDSIRIVSVEDTFEIHSTKPDWVAMQTRTASLEGDGEVDLRRLIREALRMRPGWLVVGEVRGVEATDLLVALNSGIPALCTIHANSAAEALDKLATLPLLGSSNVPIEYSRSLLNRAIGLVVHLEVAPDGTRRVAELLEVSH
jgi:pilus assembly protein CpaF